MSKRAGAWPVESKKSAPSAASPDSLVEPSSVATAVALISSVELGSAVVASKPSPSGSNASGVSVVDSEWAS